MRFHGTSIYNTKSILESGGIFSSVDINDVLIALEIIEQRIGKNVSPQLDAAWEKIKKEYLR